ncbi:MAG: Nif11-like leader peptide family natural product precursor [Oscillospiraceae bacterium]|nr:Nif11-like leader peptide family natural product precursor [Oscillospiraceae bacterium]
MSNVQKFYEALAKDEALQAKVQKLNEKYGDEKPSEGEMLAETIRFAKAEGYSFTEAELEEFMKARKTEQSREIDENELEAVAGGEVLKWPEDTSGMCVCVAAGGGGGRHTGGTIAWGCGCAFYGQGGDAAEWHWICLCVFGGGGAPGASQH